MYSTFLSLPSQLLLSISLSLSQLSPISFFCSQFTISLPSFPLVSHPDTCLPSIYFSSYQSTFTLALLFFSLPCSPPPTHLCSPTLTPSFPIIFYPSTVLPPYLSPSHSSSSPFILPPSHQLHHLTLANLPLPLLISQFFLCFLLLLPHTHFLSLPFKLSSLNRFSFSVFPSLLPLPFIPSLFSSHFSLSLSFLFFSPRSTTFSTPLHSLPPSLSSSPSLHFHLLSLPPT